jgi:hypothetical protein
MASNIVFAVALLICACNGRRVEHPSPEKKRQAQNPSLANILSSLQLAYNAPASRSNHQFAGSRALPHLRNSAYRMADDSDEMQDEMDAEKVRRVEQGMKTEAGSVELAPWLKVDAAKLVKEKQIADKKRAQIEKNRVLAVEDDEMAPGTLTAEQLPQTEDVQLKWPAIDGDFKGYEVERSMDGERDWYKLAGFEREKQLLNGFQNDGVFQFVDEACPLGSGTYRVLAMQNDGRRLLVSRTRAEVERVGDNNQIVAIIALVAAGLGGLLFSFIDDPMQY